MVAEKRVLSRKNLRQRCWVAAGPTQSFSECFLSDISNTGAKLVLERERKLPDKFDLYMTPDGSVGRNCEVVWQTGKEIGVKFVGRAVPLRASVEPVEAALIVEA